MKQNNNYHSYGVFAFVCFTLMLGSSSVHAQANAPSHAVEVGIAYHHLLDSEPDYREWAKHSNTVINIPEWSYPTVLEAEVVKLQNRFDSFEADKNLILAFDEVLIDEVKDLDNSFQFRSVSPQPFYTFSSDFAKYALFVDNLEGVNEAYAVGEQYKNIKQYHKDKLSLAAEFYIEVMSAEAEPYMFNGEEYKKLTGSLKNIRFYSFEKGELVYESIKEIESQDRIQPVVDAYILKR